MSAAHAPAGWARSATLLDRSARRVPVVRRDARAARRDAGRGRRRDPRRHGPERFGQVDPPALPGRDPRARDTGEIRFDGRRVDTLGEEERSVLRRDHFGFVFQFGQLVPELTAEENVALPLLLGGTRRARSVDAAREWFGLLGLDGLEHRRSGELSGGQAQRVALARGLVAHPEVLFADEPTGSLDSLTGERVMELLVAAAREQGTTVVARDPRASGCRVRRSRGRRARRQSHIAVARSRRVVIRLGLPPHAQRREGGGRPARRSTAAAVALGVGLLLVALAGMNAHQRAEWSDRVAQHAVFRGTGPSDRAPKAPGAVGPPTSARHDARSAVVDVRHRLLREPDDRSGRCRGHRAQLADPAGHLTSARTGAVLRVARARAAPALDSRRRARRPIPGEQIGTIGPSALPSPNSLIIVIGHTAPELSKLPGAAQVTEHQHRDRPRRRIASVGTRTGSRSSSPSARWRCSSRC